MVNIFLTSRKVVLNYSISLRGAKYTATILLESSTKNFTSQLTRFVLLHYRSLSHKILEALLKDTVYRKESFPSTESDTKILQSIYFAYEVGIISSCLNRICYRKIAKSRTRDVWELHAALLKQCLRTIVQQVTSRLSSYDVTALAIIIKPRKHQRLADQLLQSGVVTHNNRV